MRAFLARPQVAAALVLAALAAWAEPRAEAQFGVGFGFGGDPFGFYVPQMVPSPVHYLYDVSLAQIAAHANSHQPSAAQVARSSANAYWNRLRDNSGANTYSVSSRQSLSQRAGAASRPAPAAAPAPAPAPPTVPARPRVHPLDDFFVNGVRFDWPRDTPDDAADSGDRAAAEQALRTVLEQVRTGGKATAQSVAAARAKFIAYGQPSLSRVTSERSAAVANVFHYFLLFVNDTLLDLGGDGAP
jgi:hypothetical protein